MNHEKQYSRAKWENFDMRYLFSRRTFHRKLYYFRSGHMWQRLHGYRESNPRANHHQIVVDDVIKLKRNRRPSSLVIEPKIGLFWVTQTMPIAFYTSRTH